MSRTQVIAGIAPLSLAVAGTKYQVTSVSAFYKSFTFQSPAANTGVISIFDQNSVQIGELLPGLAVTWLGDNMDNGTAAKGDISTLQFSSTVGGDVLFTEINRGL